MQLQPQHLTLAELFARRLFRIPEYQRCYNWGKKQRADLFSDIVKLKEGPEDRTHFLATIVGLRRGRRRIATDEFQVVEVVDGQQRITTLVLLYKAIARAIDRTLPDESRLQEELDSLLVKGDDLSLLLLQTNHDTSEYYKNYIREGSHPDPTGAVTLADRELLSAIDECEKFVRSWEGGVLELAALLKNRLTFILHELDDEATVYTVFEVLNSRGLDVAWLDRLKSALMAVVFVSKDGSSEEAIGELHTMWGQIYRCLGLHQRRGSETLRFAATLWGRTAKSKVLGEEDAVEELRSRCATSRDAVSISNWIYQVAGAVDKLIGNRRLSAVTKIVQARLLAVSILLREDLAGERGDLLRLWEKVSFRIFGMCRRDARTKVGDYVRLAHAVTAKELGSADIAERIRALGSEDYEVDASVSQLANTDCYSEWSDELRYFLFRYEEHLAAEQGQRFSNEQWNRIWEASAADSIEHIRPQSMGDWHRDTKGIYVHRLGNLVLLPPGLNSTLGRKDPAEKSDAYTGTGLFIAAEVVRDLAGC